MKALDPGAAPTFGLADRKLASVLVPYDSGRDNIRGWKHDAADRAFGPKQFPLPAARIDAFQVGAVVGRTGLAEKPVRQAVARGNDGGLRSEQWKDALHNPRNRVCLQGDDYEILRPQLRGIVGT